VQQAATERGHEVSEVSRRFSGQLWLLVGARSRERGSGGHSHRQRELVQRQHACLPSVRVARLQERAERVRGESRARR
jgi:hypothetical protein